VTPLVICLGNPLRGDDGLGAMVAARLAAVGVPDDSVRVVGGLLPELAADVAAADGVLFVDASADLAPGEVRVAPVSGTGAGARWTHSLSPADLLALTAAVYGRTPPADLVEVGGRTFEVGAPLSVEVEAAVAPVVERVARWSADVRQGCGESSPSR
jgi:hydrogenase maturation protease